MAKKDQPVQEDNPPEYSADPTQAVPGVANDGRVIIDIDSKWAQTFRRLVDIPDEDDITEAPPPAYQPIPASQWPCPMNIVVQVVGSRGDVQPFIAFGNELQSHGHRVRIATHDIFKDFVQSAGLEFYPIGGDPHELMAYMVKNPGLIPKINTLKSGEINRKRRMIARMLRGCWESCIMPDPDTGTPFVANAIVANPPSFAHIHCAQAMAIPLHMMFTMPWSPTKAYAHPLANVQNQSTDPRTANYLSHVLVQSLTWQGLSGVIGDFRKSLQLEALPTSEAPFIIETLKISFTYCWSPALVPKPKEWKDHIQITGFLFRQPPIYTPSPELSAFLDNKLPTIYVGFGSIVVDDPKALVQKVLVAVKLVGVQAVISAGWSNLATTQTDDKVFFIGDCPHEWLFQNIDAVVHHGGAGTTAAGLLCGKPTAVIPFFGDQAFWGERIAAAGAGPRPIPHAELTASKLADAIRFCLAPETTYAAQEIADTMRHENGAQAAVASFHRSLSAKTLACDICPHLPATYSLSMRYDRDFKVSAAVAEILLAHKKVKRRRLKGYRPVPITIENRRWDPLSSFTSSTLGTAGDILGGFNDIWYGPYKVHQDAKKRALEAAAEETRSQDDSTSQLTTTSESSRALKMVGASAMSVPKMMGATLKGVAVDMPYAMTQGLRNTPNLYGDKIPQHDPVTGIGSALVVGGKEFARGVGLGVVDFFVQPVKGYQNDGVRGASLGLLKGVVGTAVKSGGGIMGLYGYTAQGLWRTIHEAANGDIRKQIFLARIQHDIVFADRDRAAVSEADVLAKFTELLKKKNNNKGKARTDGLESE